MSDIPRLPPEAVEAAAKALMDIDYPKTHRSEGREIFDEAYVLDKCEKKSTPAIHAFLDAMEVRVEQRKALDHPQGRLIGDYRLVSRWLPVEESNAT